MNLTWNFYISYQLIVKIDLKFMLLRNNIPMKSDINLSSLIFETTRNMWSTSFPEMLYKCNNILYSLMFSHIVSVDPFLSCDWTRIISCISIIICKAVPWKAFIFINHRRMNLFYVGECQDKSDLLENSTGVHIGWLGGWQVVGGLKTGRVI